MKKKLLILLGLIIVIICCGFGYYFYLMSVQEDMLKQEVIEYSNKDLYKDDYYVDVRTKGDYAYIEESVKKYFMELSNNIKKIRNYLVDEELQKIMKPSNLNEDRPNFTESYRVINEAKEELNKSKNRIIELCSEDYIKNLVSDKIHDKHQLELYNNLMCTNKDIEELKDVRMDMEELSNNLNLFLDKLKGLINILEKNDKYWYVEKNNIYMSDKDVLAKYNLEYKDLRDIVDNKLEKYKDRSISKSNSNSLVDA